MKSGHKFSLWIAFSIIIFATGCMRHKGKTTTKKPATQSTSPEEEFGHTEPAFSNVLDASDAPDDAEAHTLKSTVKKVTVYSDRARVTRFAKAQVTTEPTVFAFRNLPGWVDDGSVRVAASAGRIVDVRVERNFLAQATDESWKKAEAEHQSLTNQLAALEDELNILDAQKKQIESIKAFSLEKITKDTTIGDISVKSYGDVVSFISDSLRATASARRAVEIKRKKLTPEFEASTRKMADMKNLLKLEETTVLVTLQSSQKTPSTLELTYMLPGATWEPMHELRVSTSDSKAVEVISFAVVTQTSGEDWGNAALSFATQSSIQSVRIPELEALTLGDTHTATRLLTKKMTSFSRAQQAFKGQSHLWNKIRQRSVKKQESINFDQAYESNMEYLQVVQSKTVRIFESLQKRGTTAHFKAIAAPSVRGDGHPVRMRIGQSILTSKQKIVAAPEQSLNAARTLEMVNSTDQAFLPGKVALYQDGTFLGMTDMDFIAQGESFALFLSVADHIKLSRKLDKKKSGLIQKKRNRMRVAFVVTVENLSNKKTTLSLADRIPVSENKEIKIDSVKITPEVKPDSRGLLNWHLTLGPNETRVFKISYKIDYPSQLILETRRKRQMNQQLQMDKQSISKPKMRENYQIEEQLMDLEEAL